MAKKKQTKDTRQMSIFAYLQPESRPEPGSLDISMRLRQAVSSAIKESGKERIDICAEIYKLTGIEVSKSTLDNWSAESRCITNDCIDYNGNKRWGIPAEICPALCFVTGCWEPLFIQAEAGKFKALKGRDVVHARMGLLKEEIAKKQRELKEIERRLFSTE